MLLLLVVVYFFPEEDAVLPLWYLVVVVVAAAAAVGNSLVVFWALKVVVVVVVNMMMMVVFCGGVCTALPNIYEKREKIDTGFFSFSKTLNSFLFFSLFMYCVGGKDVSVTSSLFALSFKIEPPSTEKKKKKKKKKKSCRATCSPEKKNRKKKAGRHHIIVSSIEKRIARIKTSFEKFQKHPASSSGNQSSSPGEKTTKCARTTSTRSSRRNR